VGLGLEAMLLATQTTTVTSEVIGSRSITDNGRSLTPVFYARAAGTVGLQMSRSLDLVAGIGVHVTPYRVEADFASATFGLRFRLL
jgi:hypothetical protein